MTNKKLNIKPVGLKGREIQDRMLELMGGTLIKENVDRSVIEITKKGPDEKIYAIVRENHEYYIKTADMKESLVKEDFKYMGGLANKKDFAYPSYAKALKHLNLKFHSLNESLGLTSSANIFRDDKIVETKMSYKNYGSVPYDANIVDKKGENLSWDGVSDDAEDGVTGDNLTKNNGKGKADKEFAKLSDDIFEKVNLSDAEKIIEGMLTGEELVIPKLEADFVFENGDITVKRPMSITDTIDAIDGTIYRVTGEGTKDAMTEAATILKGLTKEEVISVLESITGKKKV
tara:strand:+ start:20039 stop:20905 length:867 start_codon:yes stop_codon:yes gene_type:complete